MDLKGCTPESSPVFYFPQMNTGNISKNRYTGNFTVIPNAILEDSRLSLKAIGLLCYILKLPSTWALHKTDLHKKLKGGRDLINGAFQELEDADYIVKTQARGKSGIFIGYNYEVFDKSQRKIRTEDHSPLTEKPVPDKPVPDNPPLVKKDSTNKKKSKTKAAPAGQGTASPKKNTFKEFIDIYHVWYKDYNHGVRPKINGAEGNAAKSLIVYFRLVSSDKAKTQGKILDAPATEVLLLDSWRYVLASWGKLDGFLQGKTRLIDINSNISNIITQIKNGHGSTKSKSSGHATMADVALAVASAYSGPGGQQGPA